LISMQKLSRLISTVFYIGYFPFVPGTIASLAGLGLFLLFRSNIFLYILTALLVILGFYFSGKAEEDLRKKDAQVIVIDEVVGILLSLILLPQARLTGWILFFIFLVFRIFDWTKPYPIRNLQKLHGSLGIMLDDILAAFYTVIIFQVFFKLTS